MITSREFTFNRAQFLRVYMRPFLRLPYLVLVVLTVLAWAMLLVVQLEWWLTCSLLLASAVPLLPAIWTLLLTLSAMEGAFFQQTRYYQFTPQAIHVHSGDETHTVPLDAIREIVVLPDVYLLVGVDGTTTYFPADIFLSEADAAQFEEWYSANTAI
jgi:hypothetical protein